MRTHLSNSRGSKVRAFGLAFVATPIAATVTRTTWPFFAGTPFVPLFGAIMITTHWGSGAAGLFAIALAAASLPFAFPHGAISWDPRVLGVFVVLAFVANRVLAGRNRIAESQRQALRDLRVSERKLRHAQKMEAIGQLVAGVAHNFNNLLTVTMGYTDILLERHGKGDPDHRDLEQIQQATARGATLVRQMLAFARTREGALALVDLARATTDLEAMLNGVIPEDIQLNVNAPDDARTGVEIEPGDLEQIVLNLVINARDALPSGGAIDIDVSNATVAAPEIPHGFEASPGSYARLRVRDNGSGMTAEVQSHLFEPFFTTKDVGEGTGLGLAFVHGVVRHGRGFITVDSAPAKGTTMSVYLPVKSAGQPHSPQVNPRVNYAN